MLKKEEKIWSYLFARINYMMFCLPYFVIFFSFLSFFCKERVFLTIGQKFVYLLKWLTIFLKVFK